MDISRTVSEINERFQSKIGNFSYPHVYLTPPVKGFPMQLGIGVRDQKARMVRLYTGPRKTFDDIISHLDTIHERDGWTDGQRRTDCGKDRAYAQSQKPDSRPTSAYTGCSQSCR